MGHGPVAVALVGLLTAACTATPSADRAANRDGGTPSASPSIATHRHVPACRTAALHQQRFSIRAGGARRSYLLSVAAGSGPRPLIIVFHGFDETARWIDRYTQLPRAGVAAGFVVATPEGFHEHWNFPRRRAVGPDDVRFVRDMVSAVGRNVCLDSSGVFVTGFSDGADMADTVACVDSGVRAVAGVASSVPVRGCRHRVDVLQIHGDADPIVPFEGGGGDRPPPFHGDEAVSVAGQMRAWQQIDECPTARATQVKARGGIRQIRSLGCAAGRSVLLIVVHGGGHTWPGASVDLPYGATSRALSATKRVLYFFEQVRGASSTENGHG